MDHLIEEARLKAIELLLSNSNKLGVLASSKQPKAKARNYLSIFGRDASICVFGMVISQDKRLVKAAKNSLLTLATFQAENGQIPNYVKPEKKSADFWYTGCIDATLWWLLAIKFYDVNSGEKLKLASQLKQPIQQALNWLLCQEHPQLRLLMQNEASDWADIMPRSGFVLYTNALWFWVKTEYALLNIKETQESFNYLFYPWQNVPKKYYLNNHCRR